MKFNFLRKTALITSLSTLAAARFRTQKNEEEIKDALAKKIMFPQISGQNSTLSKKRPKQLASVQEIFDSHINASFKGLDLKTVLTEDSETLELAEKIIEDYAAAKGFDSRSSESMRRMILAPKENDSNQKGSVQVLISRIEGSEFEAKHQEHQKSLRNGGKKNMVCVGGPAAVDQALLATIIPEIAAKTNVTYVSSGHWYSNLVNSALQVHAQHGNALNADDALTGHALLAVLAARGIINLTDNTAEAIEAINDPGYRKIHVKFTLDPEKLAIYLGNEGNWLKQKIIKKIFGKDQHDLNREESVISAEIMHAVQGSLSENLGSDFKIIEGNRRNNPISSSIHLALTEAEVEETKSENKSLAEIGIGSIELSRDRIEELFGRNNQILAAFSYQGDGHVVPQYHNSAQKVVEERGQKWLEPATVKKILLQGSEDEKAKIAGIVILDKDSERFIAADSLHFTGGYMAKLAIDDAKILDKSQLPEALSNPTTVATGASSNIILSRYYEDDLGNKLPNPSINNFIKSFGNTGQLAVTNSHWTLLAQNEDHVILRVTGGGNTGSEEYNPNYVLNNLANTLKIYQGGEEFATQTPLVGIIRTYGCPRSINYINATSFEKLADGFVVSYGKGGTGNTKRFSEAVMALDYLGYNEEVIKYFSDFKTAEGEILGEKISKMSEEVKNDRAFYLDNSDFVAKELGYREKSVFDFHDLDYSDSAVEARPPSIVYGKANLEKLSGSRQR